MSRRADTFKVMAVQLSEHEFSAEVTMPKYMCGLDNIICFPFRDSLEEAIEDAVGEIRRGLTYVYLGADENET